MWKAILFACIPDRSFSLIQSFCSEQRPSSGNLHQIKKVNRHAEEQKKECLVHDGHNEKKIIETLLRYSAGAH
jgi:hypothetical protein